MCPHVSLLTVSWADFDNVRYPLVTSDPTDVGGGGGVMNMLELRLE